MPRQLRFEYAGAVYHVVNRGDRREEIFRDDPDHQRFPLLTEACGKTDLAVILGFDGVSCIGGRLSHGGERVHTYCLMSNEFKPVDGPAETLAAHWTGSRSNPTIAA